jgi:DNA invertase Pin-like site-specific DNA recombinase/predicted RNA-binding Zn-ribbon protein involved in translation (DUF1610 family)
MERIAEERGIGLPYDPIVDAGISGQNLERKNLEKILKLAEERKINYLLTIDLDRIGRDAVESLYYIYRLRKDFGVKIIEKDGEIDMSKISDLVKAVINSLAAQIETNNLSERTQRGKIKKFMSRQWVKPTIPLGYEKNGDWIKKDLKYTLLIEDIFTLFESEQKYTVYNSINKKYKEILKEPLNSYRFKKILEDPIYIGKPKYAVYLMDAPELAFIDPTIFDRVKDIIGKKHHGNSNKKIVDVEDLVRIFGLHYAEKHLKIAVICPNCGTAMWKNGTKQVRKGIWVNNYLCPKCGKQKENPTGNELDHFINVKLLYCPYCGTPDDFTTEKVSGDFNKFTCNVCHRSFECDKSANKFLRRVEEKKRKKKDVDKITTLHLNLKNSRRKGPTLADFE